MSLPKTVSVKSGWTVGPGWTLGSGGTPAPGPSGSNGVVGFTEMTSGGNQGAWLEDPTATMITNGFILNATSGSGATSNGVAIDYLTANNLAFFSTYGTGNRTATWAAGSTYSSPMTVNLQTNQSGTPELVFFMNDVVSFPATFVFPVTFS
jgi:hypothetical protein